MMLGTILGVGFALVILAVMFSANDVKRAVEAEGISISLQIKALTNALAKKAVEDYQPQTAADILEHKKQKVSKHVPVGALVSRAEEASAQEGEK